MRSVKTCLSAQPHQHRNALIASCVLMAALFLLLCSTAQATGSGLFHPLTPDTTNLDRYQWQNRPIIVFAPSEKDADYVQQMAMLDKSKAELADRDVIVLSDTSPADNGQLRLQLRPKGFEIILVGKDGGIKLREKTPLSSETLLATIDRMPMRKANLR